MFNFLKRRNLRNEGIICNGLGNAAIEFLKEYERVYKGFWTSDWDNDLKELGAVHEARYIGKKFFGISQEAFDFVQFKVENNYKTQLKPID